MKVVLLPGLNGTDGLFKTLLDETPNSFNGSDVIVIAFPTDKALSYIQLTEYVLNHLKNIEGEYLIIGESFSGPLSLFIANKKPINLVGVILVASFITAPNLTLAKHLPWNLGFKLTKPLYRLRAILSKGTSTGFIKMISTELEKVEPHVLADRIQSIFSVDAQHSLESCPVPVGYFIGTKDSVVPKKNLAHILKVRDDVRVYEFYTQHFLLQAAPTQAWEAIDEFIKSL